MLLHDVSYQAGDSGTKEYWGIQGDRNVQKIKEESYWVVGIRIEASLSKHDFLDFKVYF